MHPKEGTGGTASYHISFLSQISNLPSSCLIIYPRQGLLMRCTARSVPFGNPFITEAQLISSQLFSRQKEKVAARILNMFECKCVKWGAPGCIPKNQWNPGFFCVVFFYKFPREMFPKQHFLREGKTPLLALQVSEENNQGSGRTLHTNFTHELLYRKSKRERATHF